MQEDIFGVGESQIRRLPVYLLLDTSYSMGGAPIEAVNRGMEFIAKELKDNPFALETVFISVITFGTQANMLVPLTELPQFDPPTVHVAGATSLGAALRLLNQSLDNDIIPNTDTERKGDYKPIVFLMTDGEPTDSNWEQAADEIKRRSKNKVASVIALGCGGNVNELVLKRITDIVLKMENVNADNITEYFQWISQSVSIASASIQQGDTEEAKADLPPPPSGIQIVL